MIRAFQDTIDRNPSKFAAIDKLRIPLAPRLPPYDDDDNQIASLINNRATTDNQQLLFKAIQETEV